MSMAIVNAACCAINVAIYVADGHHWYSLAAAVFLGLMALVAAVTDA